MDQGPSLSLRDPLASPPGARALPVVTGLGEATRPCDPTPYLKSLKSRKFMGLQDELAVAAAGRALESAGLLGRPLGRRVGLYLAVGHIPFEQEDIDRLIENSLEDGALSLRRFSSDGFQSANPLLTFRCLSNMPAFHISVNFGIQGPYLVTYPGPGQFYAALEAAAAALFEGRIEAAVVGAAAHQRNFLVEHHHRRLVPPVPPERLQDAAACLVLETPERACRREASPRGSLLEWSLSYRPYHPFEEAPQPREEFAGVEPSEGELGPASLPVALCRARGRLRHALESRDGYVASSLWELS